VIWTCGPLLVAAVVAAGTPALAVMLAAAISLVGTVWFATAPATSHWQVKRSGGRRGSAITNPGLRIVLATTALMGFGIGAVEVGLPALAVHAGSRAAAGILLGLWSIGTMVGGLAYGTRGWRSPMTARYPALLLIVAITTAPLILARSLPAAIPLSLLAGVGYAPMLACQYSLVGALTARDVATEAFAWSSSALIAGLAAGNAIAGPLVQPGGIGHAFALGCLTTAFAAVIAVAWRRRLDLEVAHREPDNVATPVSA
jgi:predicted MFS family arabinose efflux permease